MIGIGKPLLVEEDAVATFPRLFLQRQGDQIAETALGQRVLIGEEAVIRIQADIRPAFHRFGQDVRTEPACQRGRDGLLEEQPDVPAVAGARSLQSGRQVHAAARFQDGSCIFLPMRLVEIGGQEEAGLVLKHRIDAHDEIAAVVISAREMPANHFVGDGKEAAMRAVGALDLGLLAQAREPTRWRTQADSRTCRSCGSRSGEDRRRRVRERASETGRSWLRARSDDGQDRLSGPSESPTVERP